ncbi:DUF1343 domain-containing protein [bacterium]|nr:DUF1343 domain-containing protein [bacterium]
MSCPVKIGLERITEVRPDFPFGEYPALLCNEASCTAYFKNAIDYLRSCGMKLSALFGPQHGIEITDQANMIEWENQREDKTGLPVYSLYGEHRQPTRESLKGLSSFIIDLQDVGARYYTYIWTSLLTLRRCAEFSIPVIVFDRPNPLGGIEVEGSPIEPGFESFVGMSSIPQRHACTLGELLRLFAMREGLSDYLFVVPMLNWKRDMLWQETLRPWFSPSPNMPDFETALLYPGACLIEGTNISEGRGTTLPFKLIGAPWIDSSELIRELNNKGFDGIGFRAVSFKPSFDKYNGKVCRGMQLHITDKKSIKPVRLFYSIIDSVKKLYPDDFAWASPPYEYEFLKPPIDILTGSKVFREAIDNNLDFADIFKGWQEFYNRFRAEIKYSLLYE